MSKLVLIGGGGHCKSVLDTVLRTGLYENIVITDPDIEKGTRILGAAEVVGDDNELQRLYDSGYKDAFITLGALTNPSLRIRLSDLARNIGFCFPNIIDPSAILSDSVNIGEGTFVGKKVVINTEVSVGSHCIINSGAIIEHECQIGDYTHISVGAIMCGNVIIGANCLIGAGSSVLQGIHVGDNSIVGIGSTVITDVSADKTVYGLVK